MTVPIVSSIIAEDSPQHDGRRAVREVHVDHLGVEHSVTYLAEPKADVRAMLPVRAAQIEADMTAAEEARAADEQAEKERAAVLVKLPTDDLRAVLKLGTTDEAEAERAKLQAVSEKDGK